MSPEHPEFTRRGLGFPRVSGDEPKPTPYPTAQCTFSPRERG